MSPSSTFELSTTQALSLYDQEYIPPGTKYVGRTPTTRNDIFYPTSSTNLSRTYEGNKNIFHPREASHQSIILITSTIPLYSTHLGNKTTILSRPSLLPYNLPHCTQIPFYSTQSDYEDKNKRSYYWSQD